MWYPDDEDDDYISKSVFKREAEAVQVLGERLIELRVEQLLELDLPEKLYDAIVEAKRLTSHGALRRQRQYVGKLMRTSDIEAIQAKMAQWEKQSRVELAKFHQLERWRDRLVAEDEALGEFFQRYPATDLQRLRAFIRNARKEESLQKPPKAKRELFQYLRELASA